MLDNGVKVYYDSEKCTPPSVTIPDDPDLITLTLGLGGLGGLGDTLTITKGEQIFGKEAGKTYIADQFHIHSSSEHSIDGQFFEAEMHIVHLQDSLTGVSTIDEAVGKLGLDGSRPVSSHDNL